MAAPGGASQLPDRVMAPMVSPALARVPGPGCRSGQGRWARSRWAALRTATGPGATSAGLSRCTGRGWISGSSAAVPVQRQGFTWTWDGIAGPHGHCAGGRDADHVSENAGVTAGLGLGTVAQFRPCRPPRHLTRGRAAALHARRASARPCGMASTRVRDQPGGGQPRHGCCGVATVPGLQGRPIRTVQFISWPPVPVSGERQLSCA